MGYPKIEMCINIIGSHSYPPKQITLKYKDCEFYLKVFKRVFKCIVCQVSWVQYEYLILMSFATQILKYFISTTK